MYFIFNELELIYISFGAFIAGVAVFSALTLALYLLRSIGIYKLAKNNGVKNPFLAFIPLVWFYPACKLIAKAKFFKWSFDKLAIVFTVISVVTGLLSITLYTVALFPLAGYYLQGGEVYISVEELTSTSKFLPEFTNYAFNIPYYYYVKNILYPYDLQVVSVILTVCSYTHYILDIIVAVITVFMYIALFRKFWPSQYILVSILSVLGLFPILVFVIRNKKPMSYAEYLRSRGFYEVYGQNPTQGTERPPENPFAEFAEKGDTDPGDPFAEFSDKKEGGDDD